MGAGIQGPAVGALLPQIVPTEKLMRVNSINSTIQPFIMIAVAGPGRGADVLLAPGIDLLHRRDHRHPGSRPAADAARVPPVKRSQEACPASGLPGRPAGRLTYIGHNAAIKTLFIFFAFTFFLVTPVAFLTPLLVARSFGEEVWRLTANEVTFFGGSILGGILITAWGGFQNRFQTIGLSCVVWAMLFTGLGLSSARLHRLPDVYVPLGHPDAVLQRAHHHPAARNVSAADHAGPRDLACMGLIANTVMPIGMLVFGPISDVSVEALLVHGQRPDGHPWPVDLLQPASQPESCHHLIGPPPIQHGPRLALLIVDKRV
jgi:MFS transporter, DHA3 family, macrolide efflux protein